jgi:glc operon protein GlcG
MSALCQKPTTRVSQNYERGRQLRRGTPYASLAISEHKARVAATFKRPSKVFEDRVAAAGGIGVPVLTLDGVIASSGGIPLMSNGKIIGAIGVSGSPLGAIDTVSAQAGADALK